MKLKILLLILTIPFISYGATWKKVASGATVQVCPTNYVLVPALSPYTTRDFCVMKYEAKNDGYGTAVSQASGTPWVSITRANARASCQALGAKYDLISNDQWQTIARNAAGVASNWSTGVVASGELNRGHSDNAPTTALAAVVDDNDPCNGTGQTCSSTVWDSQRRTHTLSNGSVIWDFAGNVWEFVTNDNNVANGADGSISTMSGGDIRQTRYGALSSTLCATPAATPFCGMGYGWFNFNTGVIGRGGYAGYGTSTGIFASYLGYSTADALGFLGFRCVYAP